MPENINNKTSTVKDIELSFIYKKIWEGRNIIIKTIAIFFVFEIILLLITPKVYESKSTLLVETGIKSGGMSNLLQQYGGMIGLNLKDEEEALTPELYPDVIKSYPFLIELLNQPIRESKYDSVITVANYLKFHTRSTLKGKILKIPGDIINFIRGNKEKNNSKNITQKSDSVPLIITKSQYLLIKDLSDCINSEKLSSSLDNTLVISVEMQDPLVVAQINNLVVESLQRYIIDYRTQKAKTDYNFIANQHADAKSRYLDTQQALAKFRDEHNNIILASSRTEEERLQSEFNLAYNIYNTLSQQLEQAKMKVQEQTPVFTIMNPAIVPLQKSKPRTISSLISMILLGSFFGIMLVLFNDRIPIRKNKN